MSLTPAEMERRLLVLEGLVTKLSGQITNIPQQKGEKGGTQSNATVTGSLVVSLKKVLKLGFEWIGYTANVKPKENAGIVVDTSGVSVKVRADYGLNLDAYGLALKKQGAVTGTGNPTQITVVAGADMINLANLNGQFVTLSSELAAMNGAINDLIAVLKNAEVTA